MWCITKNQNKCSLTPWLHPRWVILSKFKMLIIFIQLHVTHTMQSEWITAVVQYSLDQTDNSWNTMCGLIARFLNNTCVRSHSLSADHLIQSRSANQDAHVPTGQTSSTNKKIPITKLWRQATYRGHLRVTLWSKLTSHYWRQWWQTQSKLFYLRWHSITHTHMYT